MNSLNELNPEQRRVVEFMDGPVLVLAGPGTGKTQLLSVRTANIIQNKKAAPEEILILTYTNSAAKAVKERLVKIIGSAGYDVVTGTFHSFANSVILESKEAANYIQERIQISDIERIKLLEYILDNTEGIDPVRPFRAPYIYRSELGQRISELKKEGITPGEFERRIGRLKPDGVYIEDKHLPRLKALALIYKLYEEYKDGKNKELFDERGRYDFDDMIIFALQALRDEKELKQMVRSQYKYIMVDEYQDTNGAQLSLLFELLSGDNPNLCCVGDDDQSIYRFQGASVTNFKVLKERFKDIKVITLKDNYRSTGDIINLSDKIINHLPEKERVDVKKLYPKKDYLAKAIEFHEFTTPSEELLFIAQKVREVKEAIETSKELTDDERSVPYNNIAVLVRKRDDILKIVDAFLKAGIPYATDGKEDISFEIRVRQMIDVLALAHVKNTADISEKDAVFYRVITSDYFKIPFTDILKFMGYVKLKKKAAREDDSLADITLFSEFMSSFEVKGRDERPGGKETEALKITGRIKFDDAASLHRAAWVIKRLMEGAETRPVHDLLLQYVNDAEIYKFILASYIDNNILRIRDLRSLSSFVNMVKDSDISNPAMSLADFIDEIETRKEHGLPLAGDLVTMSQEGVRIFTAHGSKGLEFHTIIIPFCIQDKNWPVKPKTNSIPLPPEIFTNREKAADKALLRELNFYDETRLFYVASTRAKSNLIYTSSPTENAVSSSYLSNIGLEGQRQDRHPKEEALLLDSLARVDKRDPLTGTEVVLKDMVVNQTLSPTSLNNYITCRRKYFYNSVLMLPSEKRLGLTFGNCVHKAMELVYKSYVERSKFPDFSFFQKAFERELGYQGVERSIRMACMRQLQTLKVWFAMESKAPVKPIGLEKKLAIMLGNNLIFTGNYDKTESVDEGGKLIRVLDYKTGTPDGHIKKIESGSKELSSDECEDYYRQLVSYKLLFDKDKKQNKGCKVSEGVLVFVEPAKETVIKYGLKKGEFINKKIALTDEMVRDLEKVVMSVWADIQALRFERLPERDEKKCGYCDFDDICWSEL